jgi:hypothetical protein
LSVEQATRVSWIFLTRGAFWLSIGAGLNEVFTIRASTGWWRVAHTFLAAGYVAGSAALLVASVADGRADSRMPTSRRARKAATRAVFLLVSGVSLYLLLPSVLELFTSWQELFELQPLWVVVAVGFVAASFLSTWTLQRIAIGASSWFAIGTSQLAANALGRVLPGGMAVAGPSSTACWAERVSRRDESCPP